MMSVELDETLTRRWYERLPEAFRDLDNGDLYAYLRVLGDMTGGLDLLIDILSGIPHYFPVTVPGPHPAVVTATPTVTIDGTIDQVTGGVILAIAKPVTRRDTKDTDVIVITTGDWMLNRPETLPTKWLPWVAQALSVDLAPIPKAQQRDWINTPASRATGSRQAIIAAAGWHLSTTARVTLTRESPEYRWRVTLNVPTSDITASLDELQAAVDAVSPAGVHVIVVPT